MSFSIKNGFKLAWAHLHDEQMLLPYIMFVVIGFAAFANTNLISLKTKTTLFIAYEILFNLFYILVRCWDDPVKFGWRDN